MADPALLLRLALVGALAGALVAEYVSAPAPIEASAARPLAAPAIAAPAPHRSGEPDPIAAEVAALLARPLFRVDRRPPRRPDGAPAAGPHEAGLPRLSGIMVSADEAQAIFEGGDKPLVAHVGDRVGDYTIAAIATGSVTLDGPQGTQTIAPQLRPRSDPAPTASGGDYGCGTSAQHRDRERADPAAADIARIDESATRDASAGTRRAAGSVRPAARCSDPSGNIRALPWPSLRGTK